MQKITEALFVLLEGPIGVYWLPTLDFGRVIRSCLEKYHDSLAVQYMQILVDLIQSQSAMGGLLQDAGQMHWLSSEI